MARVELCWAAAALGAGDGAGDATLRRMAILGMPLKACMQGSMLVAAASAARVPSQANLSSSVHPLHALSSE